MTCEKGDDDIDRGMAILVIVIVAAFSILAVVLICA